MLDLETVPEEIEEFDYEEYLRLVEQKYHGFIAAVAAVAPAPLRVDKDEIDGCLHKVAVETTNCGDELTVGQAHGIITGVVAAWPSHLQPNRKAVAKAAGWVTRYVRERQRAASETGEKPAGLSVVAAADLVAMHQDYKPPLVDGLLREGEVMNVIAAPKVGKSWLVLLMAFCLAMGRPFLGRRTVQCPVLIIDNELHPETSAMRLRSVAAAINAPLDGVHLVNLRGQLRDLPSLANDVIATAKRLGVKVIVLDALYRLLPAETSENDNSGMMQLYNCLDHIAAESGAAIVCIHHSSKGNQAEKSTTDGGAGAGAISRAADSHVFLRQHENDGLVVVDAVARSWAPMAPFVIRRDGVVWIRDDLADPGKLKGRRPERGQAKAMPMEEFLSKFLPAHPEPLASILASVEAAGAPVPASKVRGLLELAVTNRSAVRGSGHRGAICYGREPAAGDSNAPVYERVRQYLLTNPQASVAAVAGACDCPERTVYKVKAKMDPIP